MRKEARLLLSIRCMQTRHSGTDPKYDTVKYCNELEFEVARFHIRRHNAAEAVNGLIKFFVYAARAGLPTGARSNKTRRCSASKVQRL